TATTEIYTLSLHDALPISVSRYCFSGVNLALVVHRRASFIPFAVRAFLVAFKVNSSDSRGRSWTMGPMSQPRPLGMLRVSETASHSISSPSGSSRKLQYELRRHRKPLSSPS